MGLLIIHCRSGLTKRQSHLTCITYQQQKGKPVPVPVSVQRVSKGNLYLGTGMKNFDLWIKLI